MQNFSENSIIAFHKEQYQLRTSNNGRINKIVCSLFRNGEFINSKEIEYGEKNQKKLLALIKQLHEERKSEIQLIFDLSIKLEKTGSAELLNMLGLIFEKNNLHSEAIREFLKATNRNPANSTSYNNLGRAFRALKKYKSAIKVFEQGIKLNPDYADLHNNLGVIYLEQKACRYAIQEFDRAINLNPYYAEAYLNRGLTFILNEIKKEDYTLTRIFNEEVAKSLENAILMNPGYQNKHYFSGLKLLKENKLQAALDRLILAKAAGTPSSHLKEKYNYYMKLLFGNEERSYAVIGDYIKFLQALIKKYPGHADIYNDLGLAYCILRNYINERAIINFKSAIEINPKFGEAQRNLKLCTYEKTGSEIFLKAITFAKDKAGKIKHQQNSTINETSLQYQENT